MNSPSSEISGYNEYQVRDLEQERPFGVSFIVILIVIGTVVNAFLALNAWIRAEELEQPPFMAMVFIAQAVIGLAVSFGLWRLSEWARLGAVILYGLTFLVSFVLGFNEPLTNSTLVALILPAATVIYLIQPAVKDKFI